MSTRPKVFISYARKDGEEFATNLRKRLEAEHPEITLWQDRAKMEGGIGWWKQIMEALEKVQFLVLVMTPAAMESTVSRREWRYARQQGLCVYPVKGVPDTKLDWASVPRWMSKAHFFDLEHEWNTFINHLKSPCHAVRVPFMAPDLPEGFVNRPMLFEALMTQVLDKNRENPVTITTTLHGAGGLGKTTLAAALCHHDDAITAFDDGILWVTLGQKPQIQASLTKLYAALTGEHPGFVDEEDAAFHLAQKLEDKSCLIVIDDVWNLAHLKPFLRGGDYCTRLITTRNFDIASGTKRVTVDEMTPSEAIKMLTAHLPTTTEDVQLFQNLAKRLGEWPLLLELANGTLRQLVERGDKLESALNYLDEKLDDQGVVAFDQRNPLQRNQAIASTIEVSLALLSQDERERCLQLAIFPEDHDIPIRVVGDLWNLKPLATKELSLRFDTLSLIKFNLQDGTIHLHDVMRAYFLSKLESPSRLHGKLVDAWGDPRHLTEPYAWRWFIYHLVRANRNDALHDLLCDLAWLQAKLDHTDISTLITDYDFDSDADVRLVREALQLSAHVLIDDKEQLPSQLLGRLSADISPNVRKLRQMADICWTHPWLRPSLPTLIAPGGALKFTLANHTARVRAVAITPDGHRAVSASDDYTLKVWNLRRGDEERTFIGHTDWIRSVAITRDGQRAISVSDDHTLRVWDIATGAEIQVIRIYFDTLTALALTPDSRFAISASHNKTLKVWNLERGIEEHTLKGHIGKINSIAVSTNAPYAISASDDRTLRIWNTETWHSEWVLKGHTGRINAVAVSPDGEIAISASEDDTLRVWNLRRGLEQKSIMSNASLVKAVAITPDLKRIVCSEVQWIKVLDIEGKGQANILRGHADRVNSIALTWDGEYAISGSDDRTLKVWNLRRGGITDPLIQHSSQVRAIAVTRDGRRALSSSSDGSLVVWDVDRALKLQIFKGHGLWHLTLVPNSHQVLYAAGERYIRAMDIHTGIEHRAFGGHVDRVTAITVTPNGHLAFSASDDRTIQAWNIETGQEQTRIDLLDDWVRALAITPNGRFLVSGSDDFSVKVWDLTNGKEMSTAQQVMKGRQSSAHAARVNAVSITPDGKYVISGSDDHSVKAWNIVDGTEVKTYEGHAAEVSAVTVSSDGHHVISASHDCSIKVWDRITGAPIATFTGDSPMLSCAVGSLGTIVAGDQSGRVHFLRLEGVSEISPCS